MPQPAPVQQDLKGDGEAAYVGRLYELEVVLEKSSDVRLDLSGSGDWPVDSLQFQVNTADESKTTVAVGAPIITDAAQGELTLVIAPTGWASDANNLIHSRRCSYELTGLTAGANPVVLMRGGIDVRRTETTVV